MSQSPHLFHIPMETHDTGQAREYRASADSGLWLAAWQAYEDPALWRRIAKENHIINPRLVRTGQVLRIPAQRKDR
jgi:nucleoid-associated protein YgaU